MNHNLNVIHQGIIKKIPMMEESVIRSIFTETAKAVFEWIDSHPAYYQDQTFNLRDSIGVGVYKKGGLTDWIYLPAMKSDEDRKFTYKKQVSYINGRDLLNDAITDGEQSGIADYTMVLYAAAPYGILVQEGGGKRGTNWWSEGLVPYVKKRFLVYIEFYKQK